jgi:hypothetical protein
MAVYRLTSSIVVNSANGTVLGPGRVVTDTGPGAQLPSNFIPNGCCDPQDVDGVNKFYAAGPITPTVDLFQPPPLTFWEGVAGTGSPTRLYALTGLGANLPPALGIS